MILMEAFLDRAREIEAEHPTYRSGASATDGTCDCIGLVIGAIRRAGGKWTGTHGSNYAARYEVDKLRRVSKPGDLHVGDVVFKARSPGDPGYDLPPAYANHYDQHDYYHVGVVLSVVPLVIVHCTSPDTTAEMMVGGVKTKVKTSIRHDSKIGKWAYAGQLTRVDYDKREDERMDVLYQAIVATQSGPLNIRSGPGTDCVVLAKAPKGAPVDVLAEDRSDGWMHVRYGGVEGYASGKYLQRIGTSSPADTPGVRAARIVDEAGNVFEPVGSFTVQV